MRIGDAERGAAAGLLGGLLAAGAMSLVHTVLADRDHGGGPSTPQGDATVKVAAAATRLVGYRLGEAEKAPFGLPFGAAVWLGAHVVTVPALGLAESPLRQPATKEAEELLLR